MKNIKQTNKETNKKQGETTIFTAEQNLRTCEQNF